MYLYKNPNQEVLGMARVGFTPDRYEVYVNTNDGGEMLLIGSCINSPYEIYRFNSVHMPGHNEADLRTALNQFYTKHFHCKNGERVENPENQFTLAYESLRDSKDIKVEEI